MSVTTMDKNKVTNTDDKKWGKERYESVDKKIVNKGATATLSTC